MSREGSSKVVVTGGAGFIGSNIVDALVGEGYEVAVIDNLSSGREEFLRNALTTGRVGFVNADLKFSGWEDVFEGADVVYHFAANPEVKSSITDPRKHFQENVLTTFNVLEACRKNDVRALVFASSSTVYGDAEKFPTPEDHPLRPISMYGAAKLASEDLIAAYSRIYGIKSAIFRFANIVGPRQTHGVLVDFIRKLRRNSEVLEILGDGTQRKSYLHVNDLISGIEVGLNRVLRSSASYEVFNVGNEDWVTVKEIADIVIDELGLRNVEYVFRPATPDGRGWVGDVKFMLLDVKKLEGLGWRPSMTSKEALRATVKWLLKEGF
ncbi:MAG: NAD-dependent epimerase/dehydratase family protein [Desulfurococcales archaeon]|nr:NAD-dependent epimerase/dehydratase family protein [Desulfurococcales archaeon]